MPVGSTSTTSVDVRVIGASNQDLHSLVLAGKFREDLYYRMNVVEVRLPPLRSRTEDIALLASHFVDKHAGARRRTLRLAREALECLERYAWPGNIRELENLVRVLLVSCEGEEAGVDDLPARMTAGVAQDPGARPAGYGGAGDQSPLNAAIAGFEEEFLRRNLALNQGNISKTALAIGLSRVALHKKIKQYRISL